MGKTEKRPRHRLEIETTATSNGKVGTATVLVLDGDGKTVATDKGDLSRAAQRERIAKSLAKQLRDEDSPKWLDAIAAEWNRLMDQLHAANNGSAEAVAVETVEMMDAEAKCVRRPLALIDGVGYAAAWPTFRVTSAEGSTSAPQLALVRSDGAIFSDAKTGLNNRPVVELGIDVRLPSMPPPGRGWSGAGVRRFTNGERPDPADVFARVVGVVDRFLDFDRSLAQQETMCELTAAYVLATYFTEGLNVVGYLWPNGDKGTGKSTFLQVVTECAYLGSLIQGASSFPTLRDLADYGATLGFDDAEAVMDVRKTDPDKRTLLLAGSRRGAYVAVKELSPDGKTWATRFVDSFCPRLFSAIRLPDAVLGSRTIVVPLIRSADPRRAKANPANPADWPNDRRRLIDDLFAVGLEHLPAIPKYDALAAERATLCGRELDPWRGILAIALLLEDHGVPGLYGRMEKLSSAYQHERAEIEEGDRVRVLYRALMRLLHGKPDAERVQLLPKTIAEEMNRLAEEDSLGGSAEHPFARPDGVGRILKSQRFDRAPRVGRGQPWVFTLQEVTRRASSFGIVTETTADEPETDDEAAF